MGMSELNMDQESFKMIVSGIRVFSLDEEENSYNKGDQLSIFELDEDGRKTGRSMGTEIFLITRPIPGLVLIHLKVKVEVYVKNP